MRTLSRPCGLALVILIAGALLLASCSTTELAPNSSETSTGAGKPYGSLTVGGGSAVANMDPIVQGSPNRHQSLGSAIFDSLVEISPEGQLRPGIAEQWEIAADGLSQTFYLRKGVKFHDGSDLTAADVKFSMERIMTPESTNSDTSAWRSEIASVEIKDDHTIVLHLKHSQYDLLKGFNDFGSSPSVLPKKYIEEKGIDYFRQNPVGSGPWKMLRLVHGERYELEAVENHWREVPQFKNITILNVPEEATKIAMFKTGELDMAIVSPESAPTLRSAGMRIISHDGASQGYAQAYFDPDNPDKYAFGDVRVRKALSLAINRQEMSNVLYGGYAEPSAFWYARPTGYFWDASVLKPDPYDPEQAKRLLAEAGYANGFTTKMWFSGAGGLQFSHNQALAGYWRKIGVNAELAAIDASTIRTYRQPKATPEMFNTVQASIVDGGVWQFEKMTIYHSTKSNGIMLSRIPKLDELIDKVPATRDSAEKKRYALEAVVMAKNDYGKLATIDIRTVVALGPKIGGVTLTRGMVNYAYNLSLITHAR